MWLCSCCILFFSPVPLLEEHQDVPQRMLRDLRHEEERAVRGLWPVRRARFWQGEIQNYNCVYLQIVCAPTSCHFIPNTRSAMANGLLTFICLTPIYSPVTRLSRILWKKCRQQNGSDFCTAYLDLYICYYVNGCVLSNIFSFGIGVGGQWKCCSAYPLDTIFWGNVWSWTHFHIAPLLSSMCAVWRGWLPRLTLLPF